MRQFKDDEGHEWRVPFTVGHAEDIKELLDIDFLDILVGEPPPLTRISTDYRLLAQVLFIICEDQAKQREIDQKQFYKLLGGEAFHAAHDALKGALSDFFQSLGRPEVAEMIAKQQEVIDKALNLLRETCGGEKFAKHVDARLAAEVANVESQWDTGNGSGKLPDISGSIPDRSPIDSSS